MARLRTRPTSLRPRILVAVTSACGLLLTACSRPDTATAGTARATGATDVAPPDREGEDWPVFLGPRGTGVSGETGFDDVWPKSGPPVLWEKEIGTGYSAPSVRGNRLVVHHRVGDEEVVECLRADTGDPVWKFSYPSEFSDPYGYNNGPRCTPLLTEQFCYTYGAEGALACLDLATGKKVWMREMKKEFRLPDWFFGVGCTPILEGDLLIVLVGGQPNSGVVAFEAKTGKTVWQNVGRDIWDGSETGWRQQPVYEWTGDEQIVSYSSPLAATIHGKRHLLCLGRQGLVSLNPADGGLNFKYWFSSRTFESVNAARPVVIDDKVFLTAAYNAGSAMLQVNSDGSGYTELWRDPDNMQAHWSTPIHVDGYLYGFSGRHEQEALLRCLDAKTGQVVWETNGLEGELSQYKQDPFTGEITRRDTGEPVPWPFYGRGSKIQVEDQFIVLAERGTLSLVKINPQQWEERSRTSYKQIGYPAWAAPVLSRKRLYLRDENTLLCLDLKPADKAQ